MLYRQIAMKASMKELNKYPDLIFLATKKLTEIDNAIAMLNLSLSRQESIVDSQLAFDSSLKNEAQRQAKRSEMLNDVYRDSKIELIAMRHDRSLYAAALQQLENEFKIAVLAMRLKIAQLPIAD